MIEKYFSDKNEIYFSEKIAMDYLIEKCDYFTKEKENTLTQSNSYLFRVVRMMGDFAVLGTVLRRYQSTLSRVNYKVHQNCVIGFENYCKTTKEYATSTIKSYKRISENFMSFLEAKKLEVSDISPVILSNFVKTLLGYSPKMVEFTLCGVRSFLRFLHQEKYNEQDLSLAVPSVKVKKLTRIPSVWDKSDIEKLLAAVDRSNPCGKREYAILLLVAKLGLRSIDVKHLTFDNINWEENYIEFQHSKTGKINRLPLLKDVGWALIDYIKNGRPVTESNVIFLRHMAPVLPFMDSDHLHQIMMKYIRFAKIKIGNKKVGMHSLRHSLATTLLENHEPIERISDILGHQSVESTPTYLKSSLSLLKECSLDWEVES